VSGCLAVWRKELMVYFSTPIFYLTGVVFLLLGGYFFYANVAYYTVLSFQAGQNPYLAEYLNPAGMVFRPLMVNLAVIFLFIVPLLTMRLLAEEKKNGTAELLFTLPLTDWGIILGKFLAALLIYLILLLMTLGYAVGLAFITPVDWGGILVGYLGLVLLGGTFLALGLFSSSLTENQIVAAVITFGLLLFFWVTGWFQEIGAVRWQGLFKHLSMLDHFEPFARGVIDSRHLVFFGSMMYLFLFLTKRTLESRRWRG